MNRLRLAAAWLVGLAGLAGTAYLITLAGTWLGVPTFIEHDPPLIDENDTMVFSSTTLFGYTEMLMACLVGAWAGQAVFHRSWRAGFSAEGRRTFLAWLTGTGIVAILAGIIHLAFQHRHGDLAFYSRMLLELGAVIGVGYACRLWWASRPTKKMD